MNNLLSKSILKQSVKGNWKLWLVLFAVMCLVVISMASISFPEGADITYFHLFGNAIFEGTGMFLILIFCIIVGNKLVASEVDRGTMSFTLNTPTTRKQIIYSKALFFISSVVAMVLLISAVATVAILAFGAEIPMSKFWILTLGFLAFMFCISGITFCASCWFNKSGYSLLVGVGVPMGFFILGTVSSMVESLDFLKYFTINTLFAADSITMGGALDAVELTLKFGALFIIGAVLYTIGITKFLKKDLPL